MTKTDLIHRVWTTLERRFTKGELSLIVDEIFDQIETEIIEKKPVKIHNFGTFSLLRHKKTNRHLPGSEVAISVPSRYKLKFCPSSGIAKKLLELR